MRTGAKGAAYVIPLTSDGAEASPLQEGGEVVAVGSSQLAVARAAVSSVAPTQLVAPREGRANLIVKNQDASITIYIGPGGVTTATGLELKAGESIALPHQGDLFAIAASGTPAASVLELY